MTEAIGKRSNEDVRRTSKTVRRALDILIAMKDARGEIGVLELARTLRLSPTIVHRLLVTLAEAGFVTQNKNSAKYRIGHTAFEVGSVFLQYRKFEQVAQPLLQSLAAETGSTVLLGIIEGQDVLYVATIEGDGRIRVSARPGDRRPLHATATGKALLSGLTDVDVLRTLGPGPLAKSTARTITDPHQLLRELSDVREVGIACAIGESTPGLLAVASGVRDHSDQIIAAITASTIIHAVDRHTFLNIATKVRETADELSVTLGAPEHPDWRAVSSLPLFRTDQGGVFTDSR